MGTKEQSINLFEEHLTMHPEIFRNVNYGADFLRSQYGIKDLSEFRSVGTGWGGIERFVTRDSNEIQTRTRDNSDNTTI
jgi:hypothetical protein